MESITQWLNTPLVVTVVIAVIGLLIGIGMWIGSVNSDRKSFKEFMTGIRDNIKIIQSDIKSILIQLPSSSIMAGSPLKLTKLGEEISKKLEAKKWASRTSNTLQKSVLGKQPYEIQDICFDYVRDKLEPSVEQESKIKACAYESGIDKQQVLDVLAIELRDKLLELSNAPDA